APTRHGGRGYGHVLWISLRRVGGRIFLRGLRGFGLTLGGFFLRLRLAALGVHVAASRGGPVLAALFRLRGLSLLGVVGRIPTRALELERRIRDQLADLALAGRALLQRVLSDALGDLELAAFGALVLVNRHGFSGPRAS